MSIAVKTDAGWQVLGAGTSSGGGATKWGDWTIVDAPDEQNTWSAPDSQGRIWKYVAFNTAGDYTINLTGGMYWVLTVGGGGNGNGTGSFENQGQPGLVNEGFWEFGSGTQTVTVGRAGDSPDDRQQAKAAGASSIGDYGTQGAVAGMGQWETGRGATRHGEQTGYKSSITGEELEYAPGTQVPNRPGKPGAAPNKTALPGCVIIATVDEDKTDYYPPGALPGVGGWATITGIDGTAGTRYQYGDWVAYEWTADGELTTIGGLADTLLVSGGLGHNYAMTGNAPRSLLSLSAGTLSLKIGTKVGTANHDLSDTTIETSDGTLVARSGFTGYQDGTKGRVPDGIPDDITGTTVVYSRANTSTTSSSPPGSGGGAGGAAVAGACIVRVPKAHAYLGALPAGWVDA